MFSKAQGFDRPKAASAIREPTRLRSGEATGNAAEFRAPPTVRPVTGQRCRSPSPLAQTAGKIGMRSFVQTIIVALGVACCASACTQEQRAGCVIKGNIASSGERIYHVPGQRYYDRNLRPLAVMRTNVRRRYAPPDVRRDIDIVEISLGPYSYWPRPSSAHPWHCCAAPFDRAADLAIGNAAVV